MLQEFSRGSLTRSKALIPGGEENPVRAFDYFVEKVLLFAYALPCYGRPAVQFPDL
jgi:hypothetical protein